MADWSALRDVYGEASAIPALLERAAGSSDWNSPAWKQLWERLYHQGGVPSAGYAAIPSLAAIAVSRADVPVEPALHLLAAILATTDESDGLRRAHVASLRAVRPVARAKLALASSDTELVYGLQNVAAVEDLGPWQRELDGLVNEELELDCPACGDHIYLEVREEALLVTTDPDATDGAPAVGAAASEQLSTGEAELVRLAEAHGRTRVARMLTRLLSAFECPVCGARISVAEAGTA